MMEDFELDEGALYGAEEGESQLRSSDDLNAAARKSDDDGAPAVQLQQDGLGSYLNDSDDEASTTVDVGENLRDGLSSMQSFSGFTPIPENRVLSSTGAADIPSVSSETTTWEAELLHQPIRGVKMGSSAPISIPMGMRSLDKKQPEEGPPVEEKVVSATFIPPHMIGSYGDFQFNWEGASPAAVLKKDKLRTRNQIMAATGYLAQEDFNAAQTATMSGSMTSTQTAISGRLGTSSMPVAGLSAVTTGGLKAAFQAQR